MSSPRIAFLDVDGTILDHGRGIAESTVTAIRTARSNGVLVYLSTGRCAGDIHPDVSAIGFDGAITNGGAYAKVGDQTIHAEPMPIDAVARLEEFFATHRMHHFFQTDSAVYASPDTQDTVMKMLGGWAESAESEGAEGAAESKDAAGAGDAQTAPQERPRFLDIADIDRTRVAKAVFLSDETTAVEKATDELGARFHVVPGSIPLPGGTNGEIGMRGTNKGAAILTVLDHLGIDPSSAIGIGDSWNDVEMFEVCGVGIAMGNAEPELKSLADEVTTSISADGVHTAFVRHGLI